MVLNKVKTALENVSGYWIYKKKHLPVGADLKVDITKLNLLNSHIVFDVGANIGQTVVQFHKIFRRAKIYTFEPVKACYQELVKNLEGLSRVHTCNIGFGEKSEEIEIWLNPEPLDTQNSLKENLKNPDPLAKKEILSIKTIDEFCKENNIEEIDLLKIDTEGWEIQVLKGSNTLLKKHKIKAILCEVGFTNENSRNTQFIDLNKFMSDYGYYFYGLYDLSHIQLRNGCHYGNALYLSKNFLRNR